MFDASPVTRPPTPEVRGETRCPRPAEVADVLGRMLGPAPPAAARDVAELREDGASFVVVLRRASGETIGEKRLPASLACSVRAQLAAVSIAALESQPPGDDARPLAVPPLQELAPPPAGAVAPSPAATLVVMARPAAAEAPLDVEVGVSAFASVNDRDVAPAARVEVVARRGSSAWAVDLAALVEGGHRIAVTPGEASWWRWGAELALRNGLRLGGGARLEARAGLALTALRVDGHSFSRDGGSTLLDPGGVVGVRVIPFPGRVRPWLEVGGALWPRRHDLSVNGNGSRAELSVGEVFLGVGASFGASH